MASLLFAYGCGGDAELDAGHDMEAARKPPGGSILLFVAHPTPIVKLTVTSMERTMALMRARLEGVGMQDASIVRHGAEIKVLLPDGPAMQAARRVVGAPGRLAFYDWEKNVLGPDGKPHPLDQSVTGGSAAGQPGNGTQSSYEAVKRASRFPATNDPDDTTDGLVYGVDPKAKIVVCGPQATPAGVRASCRALGKKPTSLVHVPQGYIFARAEADESDKAAQATASDAFYILKDDPALLGRDVKNPEQSIDDGAGGTGQPTVTFDFTESGRKKWAKVTRTIAQRGSDQLLPGADSQTVANHFAIVLDNKLISVPYIDPRQNPDGIDGSNGSEISGGFTIKTAQRLAILIGTGELPLSLELVDDRVVNRR